MSLLYSSVMKHLIRKVFLFPLYIYKYCISPMLGPCKCRYTPSCSSYFETAVLRFGIIRGSIMGTARILRCTHFFLGGPDEVPCEWSFGEIKKGYTIFRKKKTGRKLNT